MKSRIQKDLFKKRSCIIIKLKDRKYIIYLNKYGQLINLSLNNINNNHRCKCSICKTNIHNNKGEKHKTSYNSNYNIHSSSSSSNSKDFRVNIKKLEKIKIININDNFLSFLI